MKRYAVVKTISMFEHTFIVEMGEQDTDPRPYADYVVCNDVEEFSQVHVDENVLPNSIRMMTEDAVITMFDRENDYLASWAKEQKLDYIKKVSAVRNDNK